jgi:hypothetical protein
MPLLALHSLHPHEWHFFAFLAMKIPNKTAANEENTMIREDLLSFLLRAVMSTWFCLKISLTLLRMLIRRGRDSFLHKSLKIDKAISFPTTTDSYNKMATGTSRAR